MRLVHQQPLYLRSVPPQAHFPGRVKHGRDGGGVVSDELFDNHVVHAGPAALLLNGEDEAETVAGKWLNKCKLFYKSILNAQWVDQSGHNNPPHAKQLNNDVLAPNTRDCAGYSEYRRAGQSHHGVNGNKSPLQISVIWERSMFLALIGIFALCLLAGTETGGW